MIVDLAKLRQKPKTIQLADGVDYLKLYYCLSQKYSRTYLFESLILPKQQDRYYTIGFDPLYTFSARGNTLSVSGKTEEMITTDNPYLELKKILPRIPAANSYQGGLIGYFSYEAANYFEPALDLNEHPDFPVFELGLYTDGLIYDSETEELEYYTFSEDRSELIKEFIDNLDAYSLPDKIESVASGEYSIDREQYQEIVEGTLEEIRKGNSFQVEVGFRKGYEISGDKFAVYRKLRELNPSPYMYHMKFDKRQIFGASPELVVSSVDRRILTTPTAGTVRRGQTEQEDKELARQLLNDPKELAEHAMLVDLHRNDISKVSKYGSVKVEELMHLIKFNYVQHIYSNIIGQLRRDKDSFDLLGAIMPCGVLTGAPKIETMKIIARNEKQPRGPYGGAVGRFSFNGDSVFAMPIRSLFCSGDRCYNQACGGVVFDSKPDKEYDEVVAKLTGIERAIKEAS